jgi:hypothetical protein
VNILFAQKRVSELFEIDLRLRSTLMEVRMRTDTAGEP